MSDIFCSDAGVGLMKIDADITLRAVQDCQSQEYVLPVHDSLIVPASHAERTAEIMKAAFENSSLNHGPVRSGSRDHFHKMGRTVESVCLDEWLLDARVLGFFSR